MAGAGAEKRAKKRAALREALRNRGGAPMAGEHSPTGSSASAGSPNAGFAAAGQPTLMPLVHYMDVADVANRLGLQSAKLPVNRAAIRMALQERGGMKRAAVIQAQVMPAPTEEVPEEPSTPNFRLAPGKIESAGDIWEKQADSPKEEPKSPDTPSADNGAARENATPEKCCRKPWRRLESSPSQDKISSQVRHFNRPASGDNDVPVPWRVTASHGKLRRSMTDLGTFAHTEMVTVYDGPRNVKDLRNFWGKKAGETGKTNADSKSELSMQEVPALLQRLLAAGSKTDFDEVRRLRKLITDIE